MVNTERQFTVPFDFAYYNILNIVVNTERLPCVSSNPINYNILNIVVNTEPRASS